MRIRHRIVLIVMLLMLFSSLPSRAQEKSRILSLKEIIDIAVANNPELASYSHFYEASKALYSGSDAQPNPELVVSAVDGEPIEESNSISQTLELFGRPQRRKQVALCEMNIWEARYLAHYYDLERDVAITFFDALNKYFTRLIEEENLEIAERYLEIAQKRYELGDIPQFQVLQFKIELSRARMEVEEAKLTEKNTLLQLFQLMGSTPEKYISLREASYYPPGDLPPLMKLQENALCERPRMNAAHWELSEKVARKSLILSQHNPDVVLSAYRPRIFNESSGGVMLSLAVPLLDWGSIKSEANASEQEASAAKKSIEEVRNEIMCEVESHYNEVKNLRTRLDIINYDVVEDQERMTYMIKRGYEAGLNSYLEVLEAQRALKKLKKEYYSIRAEYQKALARLERAACMELFNKKGETNEKE